LPSESARRFGFRDGRQRKRPHRTGGGAWCHSVRI